MKARVLRIVGGQHRCPLAHKEALDTTRVARAFAITGDAWTQLILREAFYGARRFSTWRERLGIPRSVLTDRLARLVSAGLFEQRLGRRGERREYRLTGMGLDMFGVAVMQGQWERRWPVRPCRIAMLSPSSTATAASVSPRRSSTTPSVIGSTRGGCAGWRMRGWSPCPRRPRAAAAPYRSRPTGRSSTARPTSWGTTGAGPCCRRPSSACAASTPSMRRWGWQHPRRPASAAGAAGPAAQTSLPDLTGPP